MKKGFTLIELLLVVLIIGILSSIALPMYSKAVEKSRAAEAFLNLKGVMDAMNRCWLVRGTYNGCGTLNENGVDWQELDIDIAEGSNYIISPYLSDAIRSSIIAAKRNVLTDPEDVDFYLIMQGARGKSTYTKICAALNQKGVEICNIIGATEACSEGGADGLYFSTAGNGMCVATE